MWRATSPRYLATSLPHPGWRRRRGPLGHPAAAEVEFSRCGTQALEIRRLAEVERVPKPSGRGLEAEGLRVTVAVVAIEHGPHEGGVDVIGEVEDFAATFG